MMRRFFTAVALVAITALAVPAAAQAQGQGRAGGRGGGGGQTAPALLDLAAAKAVLAAAEAEARRLGVSAGISVVDANSDVVLSLRLDGASARGVVSAESKARTAILFGVPTKEVQDLVAAGKPVTATLTPPTAAPGTSDVWIRQGGIPLIRDGKVVGGVGAGGASPEQDELIAKAGAAAFQ